MNLKVPASVGTVSEVCSNISIQFFHENGKHLYEVFKYL